MFKKFLISSTTEILETKFLCNGKLLLLLLFLLLLISERAMNRETVKFD